jgi:hypothetical protein
LEQRGKGRREKEVANLRRTLVMKLWDSKKFKEDCGSEYNEEKQRTGRTRRDAYYQEENRGH